MVIKRSCSFCAGEIEPGTGMMFVKKDGVAFYFCSTVCRRNQLEKGRLGHRFKWTRAYQSKLALQKIHSTASEKPAEAPAEKKPAPADKKPVAVEKKVPPQEKKAPAPQKKTTAPEKAEQPKD
jgi:large subunit ribosomal protein L24e